MIQKTAHKISFCLSYCWLHAVCYKTRHQQA